MIARLSAGIVGTLAFLGMLLSGYAAGNPLITILVRALSGLGAGLLVGLIGGYIAQSLINDAVRKNIEADESSAADPEEEVATSGSATK